MDTIDPIGMRSAAQQLARRADALRTSAATTARQVDGMVYAGPAADRFRASARSETARIVEAATRLDDAAAMLLRAAAQVEAERAQLPRGW